MSLDVDRTKKQGEIIMDGRAWDILQSNALLCAFCRKKDNPESWDDYWTGLSFPIMFSDDEHMKRTLGLVKYNGGKENLYEGAITKITFYRKMWSASDFAKVVKAFAVAFNNITIEIREDEEHAG